MFEDALLESSPRRSPVLRRVHYLISALAGTLTFVQGLYLLPVVLAPVGVRPLLIAAGMVGIIAAGYALMLCYIWTDAQQQRLPRWPWLVVILLLNLPGFLIYLVCSATKSGDWKRAAIPLAYVAESLLVGIFVLVPLIYTQALPRQLLVTEIHIAPPPGPPPAHTGAQRMRPMRRPVTDPLSMPVRIPDGIPTIVETPEPPQTDLGKGPWVLGAIADGLPQAGVGIPGGASWGSNPPPPPEPRVTPKPRMIRLGGQVIAAKGVYQPTPAYPPIALIARAQGTVMLQAIIGRDGTVQDLKVLSGPALLVRAAMEAVKTWRYQPTLLNGEPVDVLTEISVSFTLSQ
jgi:protein TonB